jgi:hypothetical protein
MIWKGNRPGGGLSGIRPGLLFSSFIFRCVFGYILNLDTIVLPQGQKKYIFLFYVMILLHFLQYDDLTKKILIYSNSENIDFISLTVTLFHFSYLHVKDIG